MPWLEPGREGGRMIEAGAGPDTGWITSGAAVPADTGLGPLATQGITIWRPRAAGTVVVGALLVAGVPAVHPIARSVAILLGAVLLVPLIGIARRTHERATSAAAALADAGTALLQAAGTPVIAAIGLRAARAVLHQHDALDVALLLITGGRLLHAEDDADPQQRGLPLADVPRDLRAALERGECVLALAAHLGLDAAHGDRRWLAPIAGHGVLQGILVVAGATSCARTSICPCTAAVATLAGQMALALERDLVARDADASAQRFRALVQHSVSGTLVLTDEGVVRYRNPAFASALGHMSGTLTAGHLAATVHAEDLPAWRELLGAAGRQSAPRMRRVRLRHTDGHWCHMEVHAVDLRDEPAVAGVVLTFRDMTHRTAVEADLVRRATHDGLTDLPNRTLLLQRMAEAIGDPDRRERTAVLYLDLDGFKAVNDRLGHSAGDELLRVVADRLRAALRGATCIARLAGDEFAVLIEGLPRLEQAERGAAIGERLLTALEAPCTVAREEVRVRASIGVAIGVTGLEDPGDLLHRADLAMYTAKAAGKGRCAVFDPRAHDTLTMQRQLQSELRGALDRHELEVRYQPIIAFADGRVSGAEALVRWHHPRRGLLGPSTFIALAEDEGLIGDVFERVLGDACRQVRRWQAALGGSAPTVSVNLSPLQLHQPGLIASVEAALRDADVTPSSLVLELTENVLVTDPQAAAQIMRGLTDIGVRLAIDDFGTGYSSLAYLRALPIDILKVDKTFVDGLESRDPSALLARTIIDLGRRLGLQTVAEGVERAEQAELLREFGCDSGQGYLFARPMPPEELLSLAAAPLRTVTRTGLSAA